MGKNLGFTTEELAKIKLICEKFGGRVTSITNKVEGENESNDRKGR